MPFEYLLHCLASRPLVLGVLLVTALVPGLGAAQDLRQLEYQANLGEVSAQMRLGDVYRKGLGVQPDQARAAYWYGRAAAQGEPAGEAFLGWMYENGQGVERNLDTARYWYEKSASAGYSWSAKRLEQLAAAEREQPAPTTRVQQRPSATEARPRAEAEQPRQITQHPKAEREVSGSVEETTFEESPETSTGGHTGDQYRAAPQTPTPSHAEVGGAVGRRDAPTRPDSWGQDTPEAGASSAFAEARVQLETLAHDALHLKTPARLQPDEAGWVTLGLERGPDPRRLPPGTGLRLTAQLLGDGLGVEVVSVEEQALRPGIPPHWAWRIAASEAGSYSIRVDLSARVAVPGEGNYGLELTGPEAVVEIGSTPWEKASGFIDTHRLGIGLTLVVPLLIWAALSIRPGRKARAA